MCKGKKDCNCGCNPQYGGYTRPMLTYAAGGLKKSPYDGLNPHFIPAIDYRAYGGLVGKDSGTQQLDYNPNAAISNNPYDFGQSVEVIDTSALEGTTRERIKDVGRTATQAIVGTTSGAMEALASMVGADININPNLKLGEMTQADLDAQQTAGRIAQTVGSAGATVAAGVLTGNPQLIAKGAAKTFDNLGNIDPNSQGLQTVSNIGQAGAQIYGMVGGTGGAPAAGGGAPLGTTVGVDAAGNAVSYAPGANPEGAGTAFGDQLNQIATSGIPMTIPMQAGGPTDPPKGSNMLPTVEISTLSNDSYNNLSQPEKFVYDRFGNNQTLPYYLKTKAPTTRGLFNLEKRDALHWEDALRMVRDSGVKHIYDTPSEWALQNPVKYKIKEGSPFFRAHARNGSIYVPPTPDPLKQELDYQNFKEQIEKQKNNGVIGDFDNMLQERKRMMGNIQLAPIPAELAHLNLRRYLNENNNFWQKIGLQRSNYGILEQQTRKSREARKKNWYDDTDVSNYSALDDLEYKTHFDPTGAEARQFQEYNLTNRLKQKFAGGGPILQKAYAPGGPNGNPTDPPKKKVIKPENIYTFPGSAETWEMISPYQGGFPLPAAEVVAERTPYDKLSYASLMAGVTQAKPWFEAGNYEMGQRVLNERQEDIKRALNAYEFTALPAALRTSDRIQNNPSELLTLHGGLDALALVPGAALGSKSLQLLGKEGRPLINQTIKNTEKFLTTQTPLRNTYRINPFRFRANPEAFYHRSPDLYNIIDETGGVLQGYGLSQAGKQAQQANQARQVSSGINLTKNPNTRLYFSKGVPLDYGRYNIKRRQDFNYELPRFSLDPLRKRYTNRQGYPGPFMVEVQGVPMGSSVKGRAPGKPPTAIGAYATPYEPIPLDQAKFYKEDWLRGYKEIPRPKGEVKPFSYRAGGPISYQPGGPIDPPYVAQASSTAVAVPPDPRKPIVYGPELKKYIADQQRLKDEARKEIEYATRRLREGYKPVTTVRDGNIIQIDPEDKFHPQHEQYMQDLRLARPFDYINTFFPSTENYKYGGGLRRWFKEEWKDVKTGKACGRKSAKDSSRPYPYCRPSKKVSSKTPATTSHKEAKSRASQKTGPKRVKPIMRKRSKK